MARGREVTTRLALQQAQKSAETLFETRSITEIKRVEAQTAKDIEAKKSQLRQLVGDSYRDLISSADAIMGMAEISARVAEDIASIRAAFDGLARTLSGADDAGAGEGDGGSTGLSARQAELYAVGSRVKFLIDTPEAIWGLLDSHQALAAARRYLCAECVHRALRDHGGHMLARHFPLLRSQWTTVASKREDISSSARALLQTGAPLTREAAALAAMALLEDGDSAWALKEYLARRGTAVAAVAAGAHADAPEASHTPRLPTPRAAAAVVGGGPSLLAARPQSPLVVHVLRAAGVLQVALWRASVLFLPPDALPGGYCGATGGAEMPAVQAALSRDDNTAAELLFEPLAPRSRRASPECVAAVSEVAAWEGALAKAIIRLGPLGAESVALLATEWLGSLAADGLATCLRGAATCAELAAVAEAARGGIAAWQTPRGEGAEGDGEATPWPEVARAVLGIQQADLWHLAFEASALARARDIVALRFQGAVSAHTARLEGALAQAAAAVNVEGAGAATAAGAWRDDVAAAAAVATGVVGSESSSASAPWRAEVGKAAAELDAAVVDIVKDAAHMVRAVPAQHGGAAPSLVRRVAGGAGARAGALAPCVRDGCAAALEGASEWLQAAATKLPTSVTSVRDAESALLVGRTAVAVVLECPTATALLRGASPWALANSHSGPYGGALGRSGAEAPSATPGKLRELTATLDAVAAGCFEIWADWAAASVATAFARELSADPLVQAQEDPASWRKVAMAAPPAAQLGEIGEVTLRLPAEPLVATSLLLARAVCELQRCGGAAAPARARRCLAEAVLDKSAAGVAGALRTLLQPPARLTERGALQLLFDAAVLRAALAPSAEGGPTGGGGAIDAVVTEAITRVDPVDWAAYEPHFWPLVKECVQRRAVLFGLVMASPPPLQIDSRTPQPQHSDAATAYLNAAPPCPRLPLLPVSTPHLAPSSAHAMRAGAGAVSVAARPGGQLTGVPSAAASAAALQARLAAAISGGPADHEGAADLAATFDFTALSLDKPMAGDTEALAKEMESTGGVAAATMATLENIGARVTGSAASALSGMSAVHQSLGSFGNVLQHQSVFSSGVFSFGKTPEK